MELYRRNIIIPLLFHRLFILTIILTSTYLFFHGKIDYGILCLIMLPVFLPFPLTSMIIKEDVIIISKFFFGFIPITYRFFLDPEKRTIISITEWVGKEQLPWLNTETLFDLLILFYPRKTLVEKYLLIYNYHERNKKLQVKLTPEEHDLVLRFVTQGPTSQAQRPQALKY